MNEDRPSRSACDSARQTTHRILDGDPIDVDARAERDRHLRFCSECKEQAEDLSRIQRALKQMPLDALPDDAMREIRDRTLDARHPALVWRPGWRVAAAAVLAVALVGLWQFVGRGPTEPSPEEVARAAAETRLVLGLTSQALRRTEIATQDLFSGEVSPALNKIPIHWPEAGGSGKGRNGHGI